VEKGEGVNFWDEFKKVCDVSAVTGCDVSSEIPMPAKLESGIHSGPRGVLLRNFIFYLNRARLGSRARGDYSTQNTND
jgi:hypothetical protein